MLDLKLKTESVTKLLTESVNTVSHFSYAPLIKCKITRKINVIFLF